MGPVDIVPISRSHFGAAIEPVSNPDRFEVGFNWTFNDSEALR